MSKKKFPSPKQTNMYKGKIKPGKTMNQYGSGLAKNDKSGYEDSGNTRRSNRGGTGSQTDFGPIRKKTNKGMKAKSDTRK